MRTSLVLTLFALLLSCKNTNNVNERPISNLQTGDSIQLRIDELNVERERLLQSTNEQNPIILNLDKQIAELIRKRDSISQ